MPTAITGALGLFPVDSENLTDLVAVVAFFLVALVFILRSMREPICGDCGHPEEFAVHDRRNYGWHEFEPEIMDKDFL